jgi:hypothetical protein
MGYQIYMVGRRWGGYGVPTFCEHPGCNEEIDRGMSFACGGEPFSELGCDRYFCSNHLYTTGFRRDGSDKRCDHERKCKCDFVDVCERCRDGKESFPYKPEHPDWVKHLLKHPSWRDWREENPEEVKKLEATKLK